MFSLCACSYDCNGRVLFRVFNSDNFVGGILKPAVHGRFLSRDFIVRPYRATKIARVRPQNCMIFSRDFVARENRTTSNMFDFQRRMLTCDWLTGLLKKLSMSGLNADVVTLIEVYE